MDYFQSKSFKNVLRSYEEAEALHHPAIMSIDDYLDVADYYRAKGHLDKTEHVVRQAMALYPDSVLPVLFYARMTILKTDSTQAAERILKEHKGCGVPEYHLLRAEVSLINDKPEAADRYLEKVWRKVNEDPDILMDDNYADDYTPEELALDLAMLFTDYQYYDHAEKWLSRTDLTDEDDYKEVEARIAMERGEVNHGEHIIRELLDGDPFNGFYWNLLADAQMHHNKTADSVSSSEYAIAIDPKDGEALKNKADGLFRLGNYEEALNYYGQASKHLKSKSAREEVMLQTACTLNLLGRSQEADEMLDRLMGKDTYSPADIMVFKGHFALQRNDIDEGVNCFREAARLAGDDKSTLLRMAVSILDNGYNVTAFLFLKTLLIPEDEDCDFGYAYLALCAYDLDRKDDFIEYTEIAVRRNPSEAQLVLSEIFPEGMDVADYVNYLKSGNRQ